MSRKRKHRRPAGAVPEEVLAEGSAPVAAASESPAAEDAVEVGTASTADEAASEHEPSNESSNEPRANELDVHAASTNGHEASNEHDVHPDSANEAPNGHDEAHELDDAPPAELPTSAAAMDALQLKHLIEALIFASDKPVTLSRLRQLTRVADIRRIEQALDALGEDYRDRGLVLQQVSGGYQFRTRTQFSVWVQQLIAGRPVRLSRAQLETLAIIAYRQPITRPEIDDIRGVDSSQTLKLLLDRALIRVLGKREEVGRPILYGTTKEFLDFFSLGDLRELPTLREYSELTDESRRRMGEMGISAGESPVREGIDASLAASHPGDGSESLESIAEPAIDANESYALAESFAVSESREPIDDGESIDGSETYGLTESFSTIESIESAAGEGFAAGSVNLDGLGEDFPAGADLDGLAAASEAAPADRDVATAPSGRDASAVDGERDAGAPPDLAADGDAGPGGDPASEG